MSLWLEKSKSLFVALSFILASSWSFAASACHYQPNGIENEIFDELNLARKDPPGYAFHLEDIEDQYQGLERRLPNNVLLTTQEGISALEEAIHALQVQKPVGPLRLDPCLGQSAAAHVIDTGPKGLVGHEGSEGESFEHRVKRFLHSYRKVGEDIQYGAADAREVVVQLLIDDGVPDRGHRKNILDSGFNAVGISCGPHKKFNSMCVIDFARE